MTHGEKNEEQAVIQDPVIPVQKNRAMQETHTTQGQHHEERPGLDQSAGHRQIGRLTQMENRREKMNADQISKTDHQPETLDPRKRRVDSLRKNPRVNVQE